MAPVTWPSPSQENAETRTTPTDSEVIIRIARVDFTVREYLSDSVCGL
jgi:hypothetical protein